MILMISLNVTLPLKFGKRPSGFAFVGYEAEESAKKAVADLNEKSRSSDLYFQVQILIIRLR
jgi:RNA recognition motif-containing protein